MIWEGFVHGLNEILSQHLPEGTEDNHEKYMALQPIRQYFLFFLSLKSRHGCACYLLYPAFLLGLFFDPEAVGDMFLRNVS
jgi:hypothetical protein